jgi:peroxiredoxin
MIGKTANVIVLAISYCWFVASAVGAGPSKALLGKVLYDDSTPAAGAVVYVLDPRHPLKVTNNTVMVSEHLTRAITDAHGKFILDNVPHDNILLFARDIEDYCAFHIVRPTENRVVKFVIDEPAQVSGRLLKGDKPIKAKKVTARYLADQPVVRYVRTATTDTKGQFQLEGVMPGWYLFQVTEEVPQVGCCFSNVVTKQFREHLQPGQQKNIKLGGTNLPFLQGKITDADGNGLHGVWVRLEPQKDQLDNMITEDLQVVWSDVTAKDGSYQLFDVPPGQYILHCFRRLALNSSARTLQATEDVTIHGPDKETQDQPKRVENTLDVKIDLEPFMPLQYDKPAPPVDGTLLDGEAFNLAEHRGKIVVLVFYASWCSACGSAVGAFDNLTEKFGQDKVLVLGINLDKSLDECRQYVSKREMRFPQFFAGPWTDSDLRKAFRVINVPTSFVIDADGNIAQIDLFGKVLENFIDKLLKADSVND